MTTTTDTAAIPTVGSVQHIMPGSGYVTFAHKGEHWTLPLIGYAIVVSWVAKDKGPDYYDDLATYETRVEPLIIAEDGMPATMHDYQSDRSSYVAWEVSQA